LEKKESPELVEIIGSLWNDLKDKQKELNRWYTEHLKPPSKLLENIDTFLDECDNISPPIVELFNGNEQNMIKIQSIPPMEENNNESHSNTLNWNEYPVYQSTLHEKSDIVQNRLVRLHRLSRQLLKIDDEFEMNHSDAEGDSSQQNTPQSDNLTMTPIVTKSASDMVKQKQNNKSKERRNSKEIGMHRFDINEMSTMLVNELQLKTDCYECGSALTRMLDPVNANEGIGIVCDGCCRSKDELDPNQFYYHCTSCESVNLCIICIAKRG